MNYLAAATGLRAIPGPALERKNEYYGNVLLTSAKVLAVHDLNLSYPGREPRGAIDADSEIGGAKVRVRNRHPSRSAPGRATLPSAKTFARVGRTEGSDRHTAERLQ